jgi:uncharacterized membrane protein YeaQ/YmgE (transglycosylase-associated protein family)
MQITQYYTINSKERIAMTLWSIIIFLLIGLVAGWLAGLIWKGGGFGFLWNIIRQLGISYSGYIASIIAAVAGALILLAVVNLFRRRR